MRGAARLATAVALVVTPLLPGPAAGATAAPYDIPLPQTFRNINPIACVTIVVPGRKDRCRTSKVPGTVDDTELVTVGVDPSGDPAVVTDRQQLVVHGAGAYLIYELGPARTAAGRNDFSQPQAELGQVVWQGFSTGTRTLDGLLTLDAGIEAARLPMSVRIDFAGNDGNHVPLQPGGQAPAAGTATITLLNLTSSPRFLAVGTAALHPLARALDTLLAAAKSGRPGVPPYAGGGLPSRIAGTVIGQTESTVTAPLRVHGTVTVPGNTGSPVSGPGTQPVPGGATVSGTLNGSVTFHAALQAGQRLGLSLDVQPWVDPRTFAPLHGARSWAAWAATRPPASAIAAATTTLVSTAAQAARAADYSPYLQTDTRGQATSSFHYEVAPATATRRAGASLSAKPGAILAACLAGLAIAGNAALLRRQW
jgi:hypothetical protein